MGGKGKRRREKNYLASHGGPTRLPPPPDPSKLDALPSKLRKLMSFTSYPHEVEEKKEKNRKASVDSEKRVKHGSQMQSEAIMDEGKNDEGLAVFTDRENNGEEIMRKGGDEKRKKKRKRNQVKDLRFEKEMEDLESHSRRQERKKKYWEAKKKKKENKKQKTEESLEDFPKQEKIRFGDVVEAPPKLAVLPKAPKSLLSASKERLRLQAIEAYRTRKGWTSRPGLQFPSMTIQPDGK